MLKLATRFLTVTLLAFASLAAAPIADAGYSFTSHTFTPCGASGISGPTQSACNTAYVTAWDDSVSNFTVASGIQLWVVPATGTYRILAKGAKGGSGLGGLGGSGASMQGDFVLTEGSVIKILVGQSGLDWSGSGGGGGGGGSFVVTNANSPLIVAGGGGGGAKTGSSGDRTGVGAVTTTSGTNSRDGVGTGGTSGSGGALTTGSWSGAGGGGFSGNGSASRQSGTNYASSGGYAFINGGTGGTAYNYYSYGANGGFGGGGAGSWGSAGGGGYSGGGADFTDGSGINEEGGGGGGSYNNGANQINVAANNAATGSVTISLLITSTTTSIALAGNANVASKGNAIVITATVDQPGRVTFYANGKKVASCINKVAASTSATCAWRPTVQGIVRIYAQLAPINGYTASTSQILTVTINRRTTPRV